MKPGIHSPAQSVEQRKIDAFGAFRSYLRLLTVFDLINFRQANSYLFYSNLAQAIGFSITISCFLFLITADAWYCLNNRYVISEIATGIGLFVNSVQFGITYIAFRVKIHIIHEAIDCLNEMVNQRKFIQIEVGSSPLQISIIFDFQMSIFVRQF